MALSRTLVIQCYRAENLAVSMITHAVSNLLQVI